MTQVSTIEAPTLASADTGKPKLAFAGAGWIGKNRMEAILKSNVAEVSYITDPSAEALNDALACTPSSSTCSSFDEILNSDAEAVVIATPSAMHAEQSIAALNKGKAVFCQKPLARNAEETEAVVKAAKENNLLLGVDLSYRHTCYRLIHDLVQKGDIGEINAVELVFHNAWGPGKDWFFDAKRSGGGCVIDLGIHLIDLMMWTLNMPMVKSVSSNLMSKGKPLQQLKHEVEDYAAALITVELESGKQVSVQLTCSWNLPAGKGADIEVNYYGTKGGAAFRNINGSFFDFKAMKMNGVESEILFEGEDDWGGRAAVDWTTRLANREKYDEKNEELIKVAKVLDQIYGRD